MPHTIKYSTPQSLALLIIRLAIAMVFLYHGSQKLFDAFGGPNYQEFAKFLASKHVPMPLESAILSGCAEFFGGLVFLVGTGLRIISIPLAFNMFVAVLFTAPNGFGVNNKPYPGCEYPVTLLLVVIAMGLLGPGEFTLDRLFRKPVKVMP
jgi:putative oxidoreductase